ncbi:hypothetical protein ACOMHN_013426 [Nucella lapillus]
MQDLYRILQCGPDASEEEIKQSFKRLALLHHPDKGPSSDSALFVQISKAWEVLKDSDLRQEYDTKWREWCSVQHLPIQEEVEFSDFDESDEDFVYPCRCGDYFVLTKSDAKWMFDIVCCQTCSLTLKVFYKSDV